MDWSDNDDLLLSLDMSNFTDLTPAVPTSSSVQPPPIQALLDQPPPVPATPVRSQVVTEASSPVVTPVRPPSYSHCSYDASSFTPLAATTYRMVSVREDMLHDLLEENKKLWKEVSYFLSNLV